MHIVFGIILLAIGALLTIKTEWFLNNFGRITWFEGQFGSSGGSRLGYKLIGFVFLFLGIIFITGSGGSFVNWFLGPLIKYN
ncbi:hypothetical protein JXK06_02415 [Patescibacteria group bacterium]|nr:hypothetical protein [Patescibacteria group bacterium]